MSRLNCPASSVRLPVTTYSAPTSRASWRSESSAIGPEAYPTMASRTITDSTTLTLPLASMRDSSRSTSAVSK